MRFEKPRISRGMLYILHFKTKIKKIEQVEELFFQFALENKGIFAFFASRPFSKANFSECILILNNLCMVYGKLISS